MYNNINRDSEYVNCLKNSVQKEYNINVDDIIPAKRGYYGETWRLNSSDGSYFIKLDYFPRHQKLLQNSLPVVEYLCNNGIDFINKVVKTNSGELYSVFNSAVLGVFEWINGENIETDDTKIPEYQMLCKIYPLTKQGFNIPAMNFSNAPAIRCYEKWEKLKSEPLNVVNNEVNSLLKHHNEKLSHCAERLLHFSELCHKNKDDFYFTHGDAGGNFFVSNGRNYFVDWDEVMYAPLERDAWVMCDRDWARELFNNTLKENNIRYELRTERLAFFCYYMFFHYLGEFLEDLTLHGKSDRIKEYFNDGWIDKNIRYADTL